LWLLWLLRVESGCEGCEETHSGLFVGTKVEECDFLHKGGLVVEAEVVVSGEGVVVGVVVVVGLRE